MKEYMILKQEKYIKHTMDFLYSELHCTGAYFLTSDGRLISHKDKHPKATQYSFRPHLDLLLRDDKVFYKTPLTSYKMRDPVLRDFLEARAIQSILVVKLQTNEVFNGYIMLYEKELSRVWQETEVALVMYVAALLEIHINNKK